MRDYGGIARRSGDAAFISLAYERFNLGALILL